VSIAVLTVLALVAVGVAATWAFLFQLAAQQGRILLRLESIEQAVRGTVSGEGTCGPGGEEMLAPQSLGVGEEVPTFSLSNLSGDVVSLADYRGKQVLLVNWSPSCGFCVRVAPEIARLQHRIRKHDTQLVFVAEGDADANRRLAEQHGLDCPILLARDSDRPEVFEGVGTPAAYLLDEEGRVKRMLHLGALEVPALARQIAKGRKRLRRQREVDESRIERGGLPAGTVAPSFSLTALDRTPISLDDYRGQRVLIVFSDPHCGPCNEVAPRLAELHPAARASGIELVMVSRGETDENARKCAEHGIDFPVVIQPGWRVSKQYGIFETPVAFLVDEEGVIVRDVAKGAAEIMAVLEEELARRKEVPIEV
jgi:peroxiredoxin